LDDYTVFLQGNPFDHTPRIVEILNKILTRENLTLNFKHISEDTVPCNLVDCKRHPGLPLASVYEKIFGKLNSDINFKFGAGAQFIVSKKQILKRPKEFYLKIVDLLEYDVNSIEGYVIERFHPLIFSDIHL
jgi:hypothetical protein